MTYLHISYKDDIKLTFFHDRVKQGHKYELRLN